MDQKLDDIEEEDNSVEIADGEQRVFSRRKCKDNQKTPGHNPHARDDEIAQRLKSASKPNSRINTEQNQVGSPMETK